MCSARSSGSGVTELPEPSCTTTLSRPRVVVCGSGSLFSGYDDLNLAVEQVFNAETIWFSEINEPVARVFAHHWPHEMVGRHGDADATGTVDEFRGFFDALGATMLDEDARVERPVT